MTPREELAKLLKEYRVQAGYRSQAALAKEMHVTRPVVTKAENAGHPIPADAVLAAYVRHTGAPKDDIDEIVERAKSGTPEWFMPYLGAESEARLIRAWNPFLVPGLFQAEKYMRTLFEADGPYAPERLAELIRTRLERQGVIGRAHVTAIIDHSVLYKMIGSPAIMAEQCTQLVTVAEHPDVALYVIPKGADTGLWGALDMATSKDNKTTVCLTTLEDMTSTAPEMVGKATREFERLLGAAMPRVESHDNIVEAQQQWKAQLLAGGSPATAGTAARTASKSATGRAR